MTADPIHPDTVTGAKVDRADGEKIGTLTQLYRDNQTGQPSWAAVQTGKHVYLMPVSDVGVDGQNLIVGFSRKHLKAAPHRDPPSELSVNAEQDLCRHYGIAYGDIDDETPQNPPPTPSTPGDVPEQNAPEAMIRSEEQLHVDTEHVQTGTARASSSTPSPRWSPRPSP